jgi:hypothetical protein
VFGYIYIVLVAEESFFFHYVVTRGCFPVGGPYAYARSPSGQHLLARSIDPDHCLRWVLRHFTGLYYTVFGTYVGCRQPASPWLLFQSVVGRHTTLCSQSPARSDHRDVYRTTERRHAPTHSAIHVVHSLTGGARASPTA